MKELSIEQKAKRYDEILARAVGANLPYYNDAIMSKVKEFVEYLLPELKESEDERTWIINYLSNRILNSTIIAEKENLKKAIAWLEKQGNLMKCLQIANSKIGDLIEENYYLRENLEKQGNNMGISEATKQKLEDNLNKALEKETPESWNKFLDEQGEQKMKTPEESLGIDSDTYNKIVDECIYGEQKPAEEYNITGIGSKNAQGKLGEMIKNLKSINEMKVEPKFKVGDWVVIDGEVLHVREVTEDGYLTDEGGLIPFRNEKEAHIWTIKDAKDGDVLCCESGWTCIFKELNHNSFGEKLFDSYCFIDRTGWFCDGAEGHTLDERINGRIYPATKEQRDTLIKAMADAGYTFDFEKKELKKIEQNPAWSEEDEEMFEHIIAKATLHFSSINYLDEEEINFLKSLKDRYTWKPSDEQIEALVSAIDVMIDNRGAGDKKTVLLSGLYHELKALLL